DRHQSALPFELSTAPGTGADNTPPGPTVGALVGSARAWNTRRITGAAAVAPNPDSSSTATPTYCGASAGAMPTNNAVSCLPATCAVPVLPATVQFGNERNAPYAVPSVELHAPLNPSMSAAR